MTGDFMEVIMTVLYALVIVVALLLAVLILIQPSKSGGFGSVFGGVGESVFGARAGSHLTKATVVLTVIFFVTLPLPRTFRPYLQSFRIPISMRAAASTTAPSSN